MILNIILGTLLYLSIGLHFKPYKTCDENYDSKYLLGSIYHIFWLPIVLCALIILSFGRWNLF